MAVVRPRSHILVALIASFIHSVKREVFTNYGGGAVTGSSAAEGTGAVTGAPATAAGTRTFTFTNVAASGTARSAALAANSAVNDFAGFSNPAIPRAGQIVFGAGWDGGSVTVHGTDYLDAVISEVVPDPGAVGVTVQLTRAFKTYTAAEKGAVGVDPATAQLQDGTALGVGADVADAAALLVADGTAEAVTLDVANNTWTPTTAPNGAHDYTLLVNVQHTHGLGTLAGPSHTHGAGTFAAGPVTAPIHFDRAEYAVTAANASSLETSRALLSAVAVAYHTHVHDELAHVVADGTNIIGDPGDTAQDIIAAIAASTLDDLEDVANALKAAYNAHRSEAGVHATADGGHAITSPDATDQGSLNTLLNELKTDLNAHLGDGLTTPSWRVVDV